MLQNRRRITWNELFMSVAMLTAQRSAIVSTQVGAVIVRDRRIISIGYNGKPASFPPFREGNYELDEIHAEANAITWAAKTGIPTDGCTLYVTVAPCIHCAKMIIQSGINEVYCFDKKALNQEACPDGLGLLEQAGIPIRLMTDDDIGGEARYVTVFHSNREENESYSR